MKRIAAVALVSTGLFTGACPDLAAQTTSAHYPNRPIRLVVPFAAGGPADLLARQVSGGLVSSMGQPVIVDNRGGAGGVIGADLVAKSASDGYTLLLSNVGDTIGVSLYKSLPYDYQRDFAPVSLVASTPFIIVVNPSIPVRTVPELIQLAKSKPGSLTFGSAGTGVASHLAGELFKQMAGIEVTHVPYKGQAPATADLLGGQIAFMFNNPLTSLSHVQSGKLRAIGVTSSRRLSAAPNIPTVAESGVPGFDVGTWFAIVVPAGTPSPIINRLSAEIARTLSDKGTRDKLEEQGVEVVGSTPEELGRLIRTDIAKWARVIKDGGITAQ